MIYLYGLLHTVSNLPFLRATPGERDKQADEAQAKCKHEEKSWTGRGTRGGRQQGTKLTTKLCRKFPPSLRYHYRSNNCWTNSCVKNEQITIRYTSRERRYDKTDVERTSGRWIILIENFSLLPQMERYSWAVRDTIALYLERARSSELDKSATFLHDERDILLKTFWLTSIERRTASPRGRN